MVTAIIFDFFGVIRTDVLKSWLTLHNYGLKDGMLTAVQRVDRGDITTDEFLAILSRMTGQSPAAILDEMEHGAALDHAVLDLIKQLKKKYKIGLLSNASSAFLRDILREQKLDPYFDVVVISSEVGLIKPQPEIFELALAQLGTRPKETLFIDDNPGNVTGGEAVGIASILYNNLDQLKTDLLARGVQL